METEKDLQKKATDGQALAELKNHHGWKEFTDILKQKYSEALSTLENMENAEARITCKVIRDIVAIIDDKINLGEQAREELKDKLFVSEG
jgi:hypothetical protein